MEVKGEGQKRRRTTNEKECRLQREDRLSSLPDDILIQIISRLPLRLAIVTESLSWRWRGLWTILTSINLDNRKSEYSAEFASAFDEIRKKITSPFIHSFSFEYIDDHQQSRWPPFMDSWLQQICDRNIRALKLTWRYHRCVGEIPKFPSVVFQTQSLVSIELGSLFVWQFPDYCDPIILPNLKNLSLHLCPSICELVEKQIKVCPSLEVLSLKCDNYNWRSSGRNIICSNQNLRRLSIHFGFFTSNNKVVINAPKLDYLAVRAPKFDTFCFDEEPIALREAKIEITSDNHGLSDEENRLVSKFYRVVSNVDVLALDVLALHGVSTVFRKTTRVTLDMKRSHNINTVLSLLELCPILDILTLKFYDIGNDDELWSLSKLGHVRNIPRVLKRIEIESYWDYTYRNPGISFLELIEYFLTNAIDLEHFKVNLTGCKELEKGSVKLKPRIELKFCKLLYQCPMISNGCEVEFVGRSLKMSRKAGPKVWRANGEVIPFRCSAWNGFTF